MNRLEFLHEECENVSRALGEALRLDYAPQQSDDFYFECDARLRRIKSSIAGLTEANEQKISAYLNELARLATWISLIERSHLGEFSWPFSDELRRLANHLLAEKNLAGPLPPIIHVVAEGRGYRIICETPVPDVSTNRRFFIIAFPRSLKYHVLLHAIFGHELGHAALQATNSAMVLQSQVLPELIKKGPLSDLAVANDWLNLPSAPTQVKETLAEFQKKYGRPFQFVESMRLYWLVELTSDLFGLLLFGPAFVAAHRALLEPTHPTAVTFDLAEPTHPPFAVRRKMLVKALRLLNWDSAIPVDIDKDAHDANNKLFEYMKSDPYPEWTSFFDDEQILAAIAGIQTLLGSLAYRQPDSNLLSKLVKRLVRALPPIIDDFDASDNPKPIELDFRHILYAGWIYWMGFPRVIPEPFFNINRLCNQALTQQQAIAATMNTAP